MKNKENKSSSRNLDSSNDSNAVKPKLLLHISNNPVKADPGIMKNTVIRYN